MSKGTRSRRSADPDLPSQTGRSGQAFFAKHKLFTDQIEPFLWWGDGLDALGLPADKIIWGYHPITFVLWLQGELKGKPVVAKDIKSAADYWGKKPPVEIKDDSADGEALWTTKMRYSARRPKASISKSWRARLRYWPTGQKLAQESEGEAHAIPPERIDKVETGEAEQREAPIQRKAPVVTRSGWLRRQQTKAQSRRCTRGPAPMAPVRPPAPLSAEMS